MLMHSNIPENQWNQVKSEIKKTWNRLDAAELEGTHGDVRAISSLVQKRYGLKGEVVDQKLDECIERCGTSAGPASFRNAASAGPADLGSNVDPSSLSASINQTSSEGVHSQSFDTPEEGLDSADSDYEYRDSRAAEDVTQNEPKQFGSAEGSMNDSRYQAGQAGNSGRSEENQKPARDQKGASFSGSRSGDRASDSAPDSRNPKDSSQEE